MREERIHNNRHNAHSTVYIKLNKSKHSIFMIYPLLSALAPILFVHRISIISYFSVIVLCATDDGWAAHFFVFFSRILRIIGIHLFRFFRVFGLRLCIHTRDVIWRCSSVFLCHVLLPFHICASRIRSSSLVSDKQTPYLCRVNRRVEYCTLPCSMTIFPLHTSSHLHGGGFVRLFWHVVLCASTFSE